MSSGHHVRSGAEDKQVESASQPPTKTYVHSRHLSDVQSHDLKKGGPEADAREKVGKQRTVSSRHIGRMVTASQAQRLLHTTQSCLDMLAYKLGHKKAFHSTRIQRPDHNECAKIPGEHGLSWRTAFTGRKYLLPIQWAEERFGLVASDGDRRKRSPGGETQQRLD